jgi:putative DNA methylase
MLYYRMTYKKKLIEVALPLDKINQAAYIENNIHTGLPSNLHTWWSRKPLGIARAIIFCSLVDDPGEYLSGKKAEAKRDELFWIVSQLADIESNADEKLLDQAKSEILKSNGGKMPTFWDPFCGGGSLPLEALRLGLPTVASDLNPVAVFITRVLINLAPRYVFHPPINPSLSHELIPNRVRFFGFKKDVEYYAEVITKKLVAEMGKYYPDAQIPKELGGGDGQVVAWVWARTVTCPNPSCRAQTPLVNKFWLSTHVGNEAYIIPIYQKETRTFSFHVHRSGQPPQGTVNRSGATCLACGNPIIFEHIRSEGVADRISYNLMALAVEGPHGRLYLDPTAEHLKAAQDCEPWWKPDSELPASALGFRVQKYGITRHRDLFTKRQMAALSCLADLIGNIREDIIRDAEGDAGYADLIQAFLSLSLSRVAQTNNTLVRWLIRKSGTSKGTPAFDRQIVSMIWEFSEGNLLGNSVGSWKAAVKNPLTALNSIPAAGLVGEAVQHDASSPWDKGRDYFISTDPPYFDAIGYADLSDFFYIWLRKSMGAFYRDIFGTLLVPKTSDLTRNLGRKDVPKKKATQQFLDRLHAAFSVMHGVASDQIPVTVYYAFKQKEEDSGTVVASTGWEILLEGLIRSGFHITATWPLRTESGSRLRAIGSNALAASVVLACRKRSPDSPSTTKRDFLEVLKKELADALKTLQHVNIAPVDLAQAAIGPGMAVYTRYAKVLDAEGKPLTVREALTLINQILDETLAEQEGDFDADSRWALAWIEQFGFADSEFGVADVLARAKNTSVAGLVEAGILVASHGRVRLLKPAELPADWDPKTDKRLTVWEMVHHLIRVLESGGEAEAAELVAKLGSKAETARELCYRLFTLCERKKRAAEALSYNALVQSWPEISRLAADHSKAEEPQKPQSELFEND